MHLQTNKQTAVVVVVLLLVVALLLVVVLLLLRWPTGMAGAGAVAHAG